MNAIYVRPLNTNDSLQVEEIDNLSGFCLEQWLEDEGYGYGIFDRDFLLGYCSVGCADDVCMAIEMHPNKTENSYFLGDVYIRSPFRKNGHGTTLVEEAIKQKIELEGCDEVTFCCPSHSGLVSFYENLGFVTVEDGTSLVMMKPKGRQIEYEFGL